MEYKQVCIEQDIQHDEQRDEYPNEPDICPKIDQKPFCLGFGKDYEVCPQFEKCYPQR